jgi:hypothetical protein
MLPGAGKLGLAALAAGASHGGRAAAPASAPLGISAAAGSGAAGGGWALGGGGLAAKLAAGCLLALGVGAGCVALEHSRGRGRHGLPHARPFAPTLPASFAGGAPPAPPNAARPAPRFGAPAARTPPSAGPLGREFTPEQAPGRAESVARGAAGTPLAAPPAPTGAGAAEREFGPG